CDARSSGYSLCAPARTASVSPIHTDLALQNSRMPCTDSSRPYPEFFTPPKGRSLYEVVMPLMNTAPASRSRAKAACSSGSVVQGVLDLSRHVVASLLGGQRPDVGRLVHRVADHQAGHLLDERGGEGVVHLLVHDEALGRDTGLPVVLAPGGGGDLGRLVDVG